MLAGLAFAVDLANMWFHRQSTQSAADAACQAGAMDMLATTSGVQLNSMGFTPGTASSCTASASATMCSYAGFNGYKGDGPQPASNIKSAWNTVSWTFPSSVAGVTAPPPSLTATPYMQVSVVESVKTYFMGIFTGSSYQKVNSTSTCGLAQSKVAAPMVVLNPTVSGSLSSNGGGGFKVLGGPQRSIQVNSTSSSAVTLGSTGLLDLSLGGPSHTGSDIGIVGPNTAPGGGFTLGTTGTWRPNVLPIPDPYAAVPPPNSVKSLTPSTTVNGKSVAYKTDGCPDQRNSCQEYGPGYYPSGINIAGGSTTAIFLPGIYYLNGPLSSNAQNNLRNAKPAGGQPTDGVMFYFLSGSFSFTGGSGADNSAWVDPVKSTDLTCDGSAPPSALNMPASISGNVLIAQCTNNGTYWDSAGDTTDSLGTPGTPGTRGILAFQAHTNTTSPSLTGSGGLAFAGALYFHSTNYADVLNMNGNGSSGTFILGEIIADQITAGGNGAINLALNPQPSTLVLKAATFQ
jgi:hypothetical protein